MFKVYWTDYLNEAHGQNIGSLNDALVFVEDLRKKGNTFVTMVSENPNQVGKSGVDSVVDGKTPDGVDYDWSKQDRAGKPRKTDKVITVDDH